MAILLTDTDTLILHIPKCAGTFIEHAAVELNVPHAKAEVIGGECPRHGTAKNYPPAARTVCVVRDPCEWIESWWRFHYDSTIFADVDCELPYADELVPIHERVGDDFSRLIRTALNQSPGLVGRIFQQYAADCDEVVRVEDLDWFLARLFQQSIDVIRNLPRSNESKRPPAHLPDALWKRWSNAERDALKIAKVASKVELGGGTRNLGDGWLNVDVTENADIRHDLDETPWPIASASVDAVYTSHCIEHVTCPIRFVREIARICRTGATVEIRAPDPMSEGAMFAGHNHVIGTTWVRHFAEFPEIYWPACERRLVLERIEPGADAHWFPKARQSERFAGWSDEEILNWVPRTCHDRRFHFTVVSS